MAWTTYQILIAVLMVFTGSINTIATKWADYLKPVGKDGKEEDFNHPFVQALSMFIGEFSCLLAFKFLYHYYKRRDYSEDQLPPSVSGTRSFNPLIFLLPALCDMTATSTMYIGLTMTNPSSFQMLRGAVIFFTGFMSVTFLKRKLRIYQWIGMFIVMAGLAIVGLSDTLLSGDTKQGDLHKIIIGDCLIVAAQFIVAIQFVVEEKFVVGKNVAPLQVVGWEGFFGMLILSALLVPMYFIKSETFFKDHHGYRMEDAIDAIYQIKNDWKAAVSISGTILSISFFNFAGISVTKELSATTRSVLDSIRTVTVWLFSMAVKWQNFSWWQLLGFAVLIIGMFLYNNVVIRPFLISVGILAGDNEVNEDEDVIVTPEDASTGEKEDPTT